MGSPFPVLAENTHLCCRRLSSTHEAAGRSESPRNIVQLERRVFIRTYIFVQDRLTGSGLGFLIGFLQPVLTFFETCLIVHLFGSHRSHNLPKSCNKLIFKAITFFPNSGNRALVSANMISWKYSQLSSRSNIREGYYDNQEESIDPTDRRRTAAPLHRFLQNRPDR